MLFFDGEVRSCVKWKKAKGGALRCQTFEEGKKYPACPTRQNSPRTGLKGGGRSQHYIRGGQKACAEVGKSTPRRKRRRSNRK